jgi:hypothetical protein
MGSEDREDRRGGGRRRRAAALLLLWVGGGRVLPGSHRIQQPARPNAAHHANETAHVSFFCVWFLFFPVRVNVGSIHFSVDLTIF